MKQMTSEKKASGLGERGDDKAHDADKEVDTSNKGRFTSGVRDVPVAFSQKVVTRMTSMPAGCAFNLLQYPPQRSLPKATVDAVYT